MARTDDGADLAALALTVSAGLIVAALAAPWAQPTDGIGWWWGGELRGWDWLPRGTRFGSLVAAAVLLGLGTARLAGRAPRTRLVVSASVPVAAAAVALVATGLHAKAVPPTHVDSVGALNVAPEWHEGALLATSGLLLGLVGIGVAVWRPAPRRPPTRRKLGLLVAAAALAGATFLDWSWSGGEELTDAWGVYHWAATAIVLLASALALAAALPRTRALLVLPLATAAMPCLDAGLHPSAPAGLSSPFAQQGSPIGDGVVLALSALVAAAVLVGTRDDAGDRPLGAAEPAAADG